MEAMHKFLEDIENKGSLSYWFLWLPGLRGFKKRASSLRQLLLLTNDLYMPSNFEATLRENYERADIVKYLVNCTNALAPNADGDMETITGRMSIQRESSFTSSEALNLQSSGSNARFAEVGIGTNFFVDFTSSGNNDGPSQNP
eukprot:1139339-Prorocentrum_minimum.AAC.1